MNLKLKQLYLNGVEDDAVNDEEFSFPKATQKPAA